jgi:hypothetical protein
MRKYLSILLALSAFALLAGNASAPASDSQYRSVSIDTSRLVVRGSRGFAINIKPILAGELSRAFGPRLGRSGSPLIVRITRVELPPSSGEENWGGNIDDSIEGIVIVPGRGQIPIRVVLPQGGSGAWYTPGFEERRMQRLLEAFAQWAAKYS